MKHERIERAAAAPGEQTLVQRSLGGHAAIGLLAGALLYIIALSGTLIVIHERWQRWEQPGVPEMQAIAPAALAEAFAAKLAADAGQPRSTHLYARLPTEALPRTTVTSDHGAMAVDAAGRPVEEEAGGWTEFVIGLHEYLHLPSTVGLILGGALGVMLTALAVTGVVAHPRIVRDAFRLRARGNRQLAQADWHNRLGVWTLPFTLALALTGAFIGLGSLNGTILAKAYHGGDLMKVYGTIFGREGATDFRPAALPDVARAMAEMQRRFPGVRPTYVTIHDPGTVGQHVQILADVPRRLIYGETFNFDAAGRFHGRVGLSDGPLGQQFAASTYKLHFGSFGGLPVELAYMACGLALCVVTATGMSLWLQKRRRKGLAAPRLEGFWTAVVWGTPLVLVALLWWRWAAGAAVPLGGGFWSAMAVLTLVAMLAPRLADPRRMRQVLAASLAVTALGHAATAGGLGAALDAGLLLAAAALFLADQPARA
ncbi:hypothetical protein GCM10011380_16770 [Sphingomonas metalli]|uniref:PepSY domain-containing protein n=1 Tax=Sphingomonas metalli TaxID=1779358 RepID=A0A916T3M1_9SPHN|nr:hypothetical protein GCM10011380_16770 [Sphingomonas metalli]